MSGTDENRVVREHELERGAVVTVATGSEDVVVQGTDSTVARILEPLDGAGDLDVARTPGRLDVRLGGPWLPFVAAIRLGARSWGTPGRRGDRRVRLEVPRTVSLEITTASGDVEVGGVTGSTAVRTVSGDVAMRAIAGALVAETTSGDIRVDATGTISARVTAVSGDLHVVAPAVARTAISTVSGDVAVDCRPDPAGDHSIQTTSGDVLLAIAGGATVSTRTVSGDVFASSPARREAGRGSPIVVGDGAARISVRTLSGDVNVTRSARPEAAAQAAPAPTEARPTVTTLAEASAPPNPGPVPVPPARPMAPAPTEAPGAEPADSGETLAILESLARGDIDVAEAERRLAGSGGAAQPGESQPDGSAAPGSAVPATVQPNGEEHGVG